MMTGVGALAVPVFDHAGAWRGAVALVGASQAIPAEPPRALIEAVVSAAAEASRNLGWREAAA
jgi:DNA-binding IclR family transcriptional regulator